MDSITKIRNNVVLPDQQKFPILCQLKTASVFLRPSSDSGLYKRSFYRATLLDWFKFITQENHSDSRILSDSVGESDPIGFDKIRCRIHSPGDNRRVVRCSRHSDTIQGEILINNIVCWGLTLDDHRSLYVSNDEKDEVKRYQLGDKIDTLVAGANGTGSRLN
ncbi:unnamed protein product [Rotaria socialis]|uniref:Uncharacterized protein n=1 Tax=Rotaria socialis TaxID=392032 RepID=A0A820UZ90_9BILA|nr:unnamed protein product [Rotaria socialis]